ncbi:GNAT family N-acetyltransferase [Alicyclobacillus sp. SO9]|uniref:GNAT family N-acetyltransferase n=1 Tax=Alicyclobacillus sp. SO9 TaxID=2665646 RepID=UPI0018E79F99|nr:GNAT family N-acetyltransferase [Alicyclobacillus sp. SO9]QQE78868.1 GNAT family N-acetyltransferase [Alicyclobacillus sp. SO9]
MLSSTDSRSELESRRLVFRRYCDEDLPFLEALLANPEVMRYIGNGQVRDKAEARTFLSRIYDMYATGEMMGLRILERKTDRSAIGHAGIVLQVVDDAIELEIGYWIAREYWMQGYATEAAARLKEYGTQELENSRFVSLIQPGNTGSRKVALHIGMKLEKEIKRNGQDVLVYATCT